MLEWWLERGTRIALYQEINLRLLSNGGEGADSCLFLNAQNKQTEKKIIAPLRKMGIPAAAIVDIDILKKNGLKELLRRPTSRQPLIQSLGVLRGTFVRPSTMQVLI